MREVVLAQQSALDELREFILPLWEELLEHPIGWLIPIGVFVLFAIKWGAAARARRRDPDS